MENLHDLRSGSVDSQRLNHWRTVTWDPGIVDSRALSVCYDCLCLMALFRAVMSLARYWAVEFVWTDPTRGLVVQSPGMNGIYHGYIHPVLWIDYVVIRRRSKSRDLPSCLIGLGTIAPGGVLVCAVLRRGSFPWEGFCSCWLDAAPVWAVR